MATTLVHLTVRSRATSALAVVAVTFYDDYASLQLSMTLTGMI